MRIGVLADTHIPDRYEEIPSPLLKDLENCDLIIHAGDFTSLEYYETLKALKPLKAVLGNLDAPDLRPVLKEKEVFTVEKFKIGLIHGFGQAETVFENVRKSFDGACDLVIFGHTHNAFLKKIQKTLYLNPGSPTDKIFTTTNSYGIIEIGKTIQAKIIKL